MILYPKSSLLVLITGVLLACSRAESFASEATRATYLQMLQEHPSLFKTIGSFKNGEIEIVTDPSAMRRIEEKLGRDVGVVALDRYWLWLNDACIFPNGSEGVYGRILWTRQMQQEYAGVAVLPILPTGQVVLNCNFRHATRSWELELPRGLIEKGEMPAQAAIREAKEETGMDLDKLHFLGMINPDSGIFACTIPLFAAEVISQGTIEKESSEAIEGCVLLTINEIKKLFVAGCCELEIRDKKQVVYIRDPFLASALFLFESRVSQP